MDNAPILILGGAGFIGSHMVDYSIANGHSVVVLDSLVSGFRDSVHKDAVFYHGDIADYALVKKIITTHRIESVIHFAAFIEVGESMRDPEKYYHNNVTKSLALLRTLKQCAVKNIVFSSTAAIYGTPTTKKISENHPCDPVSVYGATKLAIERALKGYHQAHGLNYIALRYFNAAGAHPNGHLSERHQPETHLIPILLEVAAGERDHFCVYGSDYDTEDGTCVRDFIHVQDLCSAHLAALEYLNHGGESTAFNLGTNTGHSVKQIITATQTITQKNIPCVDSGRRRGDPDVLVADNKKITATLNWKPIFSDIHCILEHAWRAKLLQKEGIQA